MRKIVLLCNAGLSTSMLVDKMRKEAEAIGYECTINAYPVAEVHEKMQTSFYLDRRSATRLRK